MIEHAYALRKGVGPFSAGTRIIIHNENKQDGTVTIEIPIKPNKTFKFEDCIFDIDENLVVKLRDMSSEVPENNRAARRRTR